MKLLIILNKITKSHTKKYNTRISLAHKIQHRMDKQIKTRNLNHQKLHQNIIESKQNKFTHKRERAHQQIWHSEFQHT